MQMNYFPQAFQLFEKSAEHITYIHIHVYVYAFVYVYMCIHDFPSHVTLKNKWFPAMCNKSYNSQPSLSEDSYIV